MLPPSPRTSPESWAPIEIATKKRTFTHPGLDGEGSCVVKAKSSQTIDQAKAVGRDKAKTKLAGRKPIPVDVELIFSARCYDAIGGTKEMLEQIQPDGDENGGPFEVRAADVNWRGVTACVVEEVGPIEWKGELGRCVVKMVQWVPDTTGNGTKTPKNAAPYQGREPFPVAEGKCSDDNGKTTQVVPLRSIKGFASKLKVPGAGPPGHATATGKAT